MAELRAVLAVAGIALGCAVALAATNRLTEAPIEHNETAAERAVLLHLLGADFDDRVPAPDLAQQPAAWDYCGRVRLARLDVAGYGGPIRLLFTLPADGRLGRLALLSHQETPGITDFLRDDAWLATLGNAKATELRSADAITGATITSRAITGGLASALEAPEAFGAIHSLECPP
ncbi:MAG: FMN-binding protein [Pseudomonadales bacterium]